MEIYKIVNLINGKMYIGQTIKTFNERYQFKGVGVERVLAYLEMRENKTDKYSSKLYYNNHLLKAIRKHGTENFTVEIIDTAENIDDLNKKEIEWIRHFNSKENGYNQCDGGLSNSGWKMSDETKEYLSKIRKGKATGKDNPNFGKIHSKETRNKMSLGRSGKITGSDNPKSRKVINLDTLEVFETLTLACNKYKIPSGDLTKVCQRNERGTHGVRKSTGGYRWMYHDEYLSDGDVVGPYKNDHYKAVINIDTGEVFETIKKASVFYEIDDSSIAKVCKGKLKSAGGFKWKYYKE